LSLLEGTIGRVEQSVCCGAAQPTGALATKSTFARLSFQALEAKSSEVGILPATRPEGRLVSPGSVIETEPRPALSGVSIHR
jgi:hypothetical protein